MTKKLIGSKAAPRTFSTFYSCRSYIRFQHFVLDVRCLRLVYILSMTGLLCTVQKLNYIIWGGDFENFNLLTHGIPNFCPFCSISYRFRDSIFGQPKFTKFCKMPTFGQFILDICQKLIKLPERHIKQVYIAN